MRISQEIFDVMRPMPPFIPELRQANRDGKKSQTRRVVNPQPDKAWTDKYLHRGRDEDIVRGSILSESFIARCKYGKIGDVAYMREPLVIGDGGYAFYKDDGAPVFHVITGFHVQWEWKVKTLSQLYMPKFAARSIFRYEVIRVERLKSITHEDSILEGFYDKDRMGTWGRLGFSLLWDKLNKARGFAWDTNPWVWVLGYKPLKYKTLLILDDPFENMSNEDIEKLIHEAGEKIKVKNET